MHSRATYTKNNGVLSSPADWLRRSALAVFSLLMFLVIQQDVFAADAAKGQQLFQANCARCHSTVLTQDLTGPALYEVSERVPSKEWLYGWIRNSAEIIATGDEYANSIYEEWNKSAMSAMPHLTNEDIDDIVAWIDGWAPPADDAEGGAATITVGDDDTLSGLRSLAILLGLVVLGLLGLIGAQVARLRGIEFFGGVNFDKLNARLFLGFFVVGMIAVFWSTSLYTDFFVLDNAASAHGQEIDQLFWITMVVVFGVFVLTNAVLFFFAYRYGKDGGRKARYYPENNRLEMIWTVVPAITLTILVIFGIRTWNSTMGAPDPSEEVLLVEISGEQWGWTLRYPGPDKELGDLDVRRIAGANNLGVNMSNPRSHDDFISNDLVLKKGQRVDLKIRSRDVLHSVYLPHFRVKMDAVPGMDTRFHFVPLYTSSEYRQILKEGGGYWAELDSVRTMEVEKMRIENGDTITFKETVVDSVFHYEGFDYELACTEVCGRGHFSMAKKVIVLEPEEYDAWFDSIKTHSLITQIPYEPSDEFPQYEGDLADEGSVSGKTPILE